jgi:hypothetical protein
VVKLVGGIERFHPAAHIAKRDGLSFRSHE